MRAIKQPPSGGEGQGQGLEIPFANRGLTGEIGSKTPTAKNVAPVLDRYAASNEVVAALVNSLPAVESEEAQGTKGKKRGEVAARTEGTTQDRLAALAEDPAAFRAFLTKLSEALYLSGSGRPPRVSDASYALLQQVGSALAELRELGGPDKAPKSTTLLAALQELRQQMVDYTLQGNAKRADMPALDEQHRVIDAAIRAEQAAFLKSVPTPLRQQLQKSGIYSTPPRLPEGYKGGLATLESAGLLQSFESPAGKVYAFADARKVNTKLFEATVSAGDREKLGQAIATDLNLRYLGGSKSLGTNTREDGPNLLDQNRIAKIAAAAGVPVALVQVALRYHLERGSLEIKDDGFVLSKMGRAAGLGAFADRLRANASDEPPKVTNLSDYLKAADAKAAETKRIGTQLVTPDGAFPKGTMFIDDVVIGDYRQATKLVREVVDRMKKNPEALLIGMNLVAGSNSVHGKRNTRNHVEGAGNFADQLRIAHELMTLAGRPTLVLPGERDRLQIEERTAALFARDTLLDRAANATEAEASTMVSKLDKRAFDKLRSKNNGKWQEIESFLMRTVLPFEYMRGSALRDVPQVKALTGLEMHEYDVLLHATELLEKGEGHKALELYGALISPPELEMLKVALSRSDAPLEKGRLTVRDGTDLQLVTPDGKKGLTVSVNATRSFSPATQAKDPLSVLSSELKGRQAQGLKTPDVAIVGGQGLTVIQQVGPTTAISLPSLRQEDDQSQGYNRRPQDEMSRRVNNRKMIDRAGVLEVSGGHDGAFEFKFINDKFREKIEAQKDQPKKERLIGMLSDFQVGSDTMRPEAVVRGIDYMINTLGVDTLVLNGDLVQGQNYPRFPAENNHVGLIGIENQARFVLDMLKPFFDQKPDLKLVILPGNHEWNSQAGKGQQGTHHLLGIVAYAEAKLGSDKVEYVVNFVDKHGHKVDFPATMLDEVKADTGYGVLVQHLYNGGGGGKSGKLSAPSFTQAAWQGSFAPEAVDVTVGGHFHTPSFVGSNGSVHIGLGGAAGQSGFEYNLGYTDAQPTFAVMKLSNHDYPTVKLLTENYLQKQEIRNPELRGIVGSRGERMDDWMHHLVRKASLTPGTPSSVDGEKHESRWNRRPTLVDS